MPWKVEQRDGRHCVVKKSDGQVVGCHASAEEARAQVRALYASEPNLALRVVEAARERDVNAPGGGHDLRNYWVRGEGAAKIRWGTDGSFARCVANLGKHVKDPQGLCAEYHKAATGEWPAEKGVESSVSGLEEFHGNHNQQDHDPTKGKGGRKQRGGIEDEYDFNLTAAKKAPADEPWEGTLVVEGAESGDGRMFALGSLDWAQLPLPLMYQPANVGGHNESVMVGQIEHAARKGNEIRGWGKVFGQALASEHGPGIRTMMADNGPGGVSVDVDKVKDADVEMVYADSEQGANPFAKPETTIFHRGRVRGATLVAFPAFVEAKLKFTNQVVTASADADEDCGCSADRVLTAAAHTITIPDVPPAHWFSEPTDVQLSGALTITDEGRVYGILAPGNTTHRDRKVKAPRGNVDYSRFHKAETIVEGGKRVVTGVITADCGHAPTQGYGTLQNRIDHYDNSCSVLANVRIGESKNGYIWAAGALNAGADPRQVARAFGCTLSGDWQPHPDRPGVREFIAAHLVPVPGFPMARTQASVGYEDGLITAAAVPVRHVAVAEPRVTGVASDAVALAKLTLARSIGRDPASRKQALHRQIH